MPPCARSKAPFTCFTAPVKAPFSCPNSVLSTRFSGSAAQLMEMKGPSLRSLRLWTVRARSSLPVPDSPWMRTAARVGATTCTVSRIRRSASLSPMISRVERNWVTSSFSWAFSRRRRLNSSAWFTASSSCCGRMGLVM